MSIEIRRGVVAALAVLLLVGSSGGAAWAAGTTAGTPIANSATVNYSVGGQSQTPIESSEAGNNTPGAGAPTTFTVDRKIDVLVEEEGNAFTTSRPGQNDQVLTFLVTNEGNDAQDFLLTAVDGNGNTITLGGVTETDDFDATAPTPPGIWVDTDNDGSFNATNDTEVAYLDGLAVDAANRVRVFIVRNIDVAELDGTESFVTLHAQAVANSGTPAAPGAPLTADTGANVQNDAAGSEQVVFADDDGSATGGTDALRDGAHSATDGYLVRSSQLSISKNVVVVRDPFGAVAPNAKAIPGSIVEYEIVVANDAGATESATGVSITDDLTAEMSGAAGGPRLALSLAEYGSQAAGDDIEYVFDAAGPTAPVTAEYSASADADDGQFVSDVLNVSNIVLAPGDTATVRFRVEIQ